MAKEKVDLSQFEWMNKPENVRFIEDGLEFTTSPETDFWQRTDYGFRRNNGHALLVRLWDDFTFSVQTEFFYEKEFDQSGLMLYMDEDNWTKASLEFGGDDEPSMLGSVVTGHGYSDWATTALEPEVNRLFFRISRRGSDFRIDCSRDGDAYEQIRVFHAFGDLSLAKVGVYACSPQDSSFNVRFLEMAVEPSVWID